MLDSVLDLTLERNRDLLRRGTVLVDERDASDTPRVLFYLEHAIQEVKTKPSSGGIMGLLKVFRNRDNQDFIRFVLVFGRRLKERCLNR